MFTFSGFSPSIRKLFQNYGSYRPNRRFLLQIIVAMILRLDESLSAISSDFARNRSEWLAEIEADLSLIEDEKRILFKEESGTASQRGVLPPGTKLELSTSVSPAVLKIGIYFVNEVHKRADGSPNLDLHGRLQLLAQTKIVDKFYFTFVGIMHRNRKIRYMENMLYYAVVKRAMPPVVYEVLYYKFHLVVNINSAGSSSRSAFNLRGTGVHDYQGYEKDLRKLLQGSLYSITRDNDRWSCVWCHLLVGGAFWKCQAF